MWGFIYLNFICLRIWCYISIFVIKMKKCYKCQIKKEYSEFSKDKSRPDGYDNRCKECSKKYRKKIKNKLKDYYEKYNAQNIEYIKEYRRKYYKENKQYFKNYNKNNSKTYIKDKNKTNTYLKNKRKSDPMFKMKSYLRNRTCAAFKFHSWKKGGSTEKLLGADYKIVHKHIESTFIKGMTWDNYGEWHIDHKIPLASASTEIELKTLCHYTNLQALWAEDNIRKGDKLNYS